MNGNRDPERLARILVSKLGEKAPTKAAELVGQTFDSGKTSTSRILEDVLAAIEGMARSQKTRE